MERVPIFSVLLILVVSVAGYSQTTPSSTPKPVDNNEWIRLNSAGALKLKNKDLAGAVTDYSKCLAITKALPCYIGRATAYTSQQKYDLALKDAIAARDLDPKAADAYSLLATINGLKGEIYTAISNMAEAIRYDPANADYYLQRAALRCRAELKPLATLDEEKANQLGAVVNKPCVSAVSANPNTPVVSARGSPGETVLFFDGFDDNRHNWPVGTSDYVDGIIANGRQTIDLRTDVYHRTMLGTAIAPQIDQTKDFMIETSLTFLSGNDYYPFGINWGMKDLNQNSFEFNIARGNFMHAKIVAGQYVNIITWTAHSAVKTGAGATNKLTIRKRGTKLELSVNDTLVATRDYEPYTAPASIGFNIGFKKKIEIDFLKVVQFK